MTNASDQEKGTSRPPRITTVPQTTLQSELLRVHEAFDVELDRRERRLLATFGIAACAVLIDSSKS